MESGRYRFRPDGSVCDPSCEVWDDEKGDISECGLCVFVQRCEFG